MTPEELDRIEADARGVYTRAERHVPALVAEVRRLVDYMDGLNEQAMSETGRANAAEAEVRRLRVLLAEAQWADAHWSGYYCPWCEGEMKDGHDPACRAFPRSDTSAPTLPSCTVRE